MGQKLRMPENLLMDQSTSRSSSDLNGQPCSHTAVILSRSLGICTASTEAGGEGEVKLPSAL